MFKVLFTHVHTHIESTRFEEMRKAYTRETREVMLCKSFGVRCSDDEEENDNEKEYGTFPGLNSTALNVTSATDSADAADTDGGECSGQISQQPITENR